MGNSKENIAELTNLPNYKDSFTDPLAEFGVTTIDDLCQVLIDDERTASMISAVKGLGPRTVEVWKKALALHEEPTEAEPVESAAEPEPAEPEEEPVTEETEEPSAKETEQVVEETEDITTTPKFERNLFCTMADLNEIQRTTVDLLQMNGSKKKGLTASVDYIAKKLTGAGMDVTINKESGFPVIVASKGEGGLVLWGHLDTERLAGMKRKKQGMIQGGMINGRGAANIKGAVAAMVCAANRLVPWQVPFSIVLTTDALGQQKGSELMANDSVITHSKGIIMFAPTGMTPVIGQYGYAAILVRTLGDDAVMKMASFLKMLNGHIEDSSGRLSVKTGLIRGGKKKMPYAPALSCEVVMELETMDDTDSAIGTIKDLLEGIEHDIDILCRSEMAEFDRTSDLIAEVTELTKMGPVFEMAHSEAANIVAANPKIVICGPGNVANSLSDQEYITLSDLEKTFESILSLIDWSAPIEGE
ncbi:MAG: M20/M25/M40 family metallo-hydrolase [Methanomassiliicoccales archaeon]|jgi:acetylornithine deacetylase/succinyl-diaminopimelate desuccinylase-like protein